MSSMRLPSSTFEVFEGQKEIAILNLGLALPHHLHNVLILLYLAHPIALLKERSNGATRAVLHAFTGLHCEYSAWARNYGRLYDDC